MDCKHNIVNIGGHILCDFGGCCPYQYWCNKDRCYKSTATPLKCKKYEKADETNKK